jgi:hypothetical protein
MGLILRHLEDSLGLLLCEVVVEEVGSFWPLPLPRQIVLAG